MRAIFVTAVLFLFLLSGSTAWGRSVTRFECGTRFVSVGDSRYEVLSRCGEPTWRDAWDEERLERVSGVPYMDGSGYYGSRTPFVVKVHVWVEEWVYNQGPQRFMRILRFENNRLINIEVGDYGH